MLLPHGALDLLQTDMDEEGSGRDSDSSIILQVDVSVSSPHQGQVEDVGPEVLFRRGGARTQDQATRRSGLHSELQEREVVPGDRERSELVPRLVEAILKSINSSPYVYKVQL